MNHNPFGALCYKQRSLPSDCSQSSVGGRSGNKSVLRQGCPTGLGASTKDFVSLEEVSWARLEVREGFQEEAASES